MGLRYGGSRRGAGVRAGRDGQPLPSPGGLCRAQRTVGGSLQGPTPRRAASKGVENQRAVEGPQRPRTKSTGKGLSLVVVSANLW